MLLFTPTACDGDPEEALVELASEVDVIQIRPKALGSSRAPAPANDCLFWARKALELAGTGDHAPLILVDDRVDVARLLWDEGVAGVHLGQDDAPARAAREELGPHPLIGLSTHDLEQVVLAGEEPIDYVGFGPIHTTATKGYERGIGPERAWVASAAAPGPLFPIGGIDDRNAESLAEVGRAAIGSALLNAEDRSATARALRALLAT